MRSNDKTHQPVMLEEVTKFLSPKDNMVYVDGTFGSGGYSKRILELANCQVLAIDRDPEALKLGKRLEKESKGRLILLEGSFGKMVELLKSKGITNVDGVVLDLGISSMQLNDPERGFSFSLDGPLDMRMNRKDTKKLTAEKLINHLSEKELAKIIYEYGEEKFSKRIAKAIVQKRRNGPIERTSELANIIRGVVRGSHDGIDPATKTFMALRIYINNEIQEINKGLKASEFLLKPGGKIIIVSFHSLEDREVKKFLVKCANKPRGTSRHLPKPKDMEFVPTLKILTKKIVRPTHEETLDNSRARSARLRAAERTSAPTLTHQSQTKMEGDKNAY